MLGGVYLLAGLASGPAVQRAPGILDCVSWLGGKRMPSLSEMPASVLLTLQEDGMDSGGNMVHS